MPGSEPVSPAAGCTGASCAEPQPTEPTVPDNGVAGAPAEEPEAWTLLIEGEWQLPAGSEGYRCVRQTLQQDIHIAGLRALSPQGTHHTVLGVGPSTGPDGISDCNAGELGQRMVFGSGVGTDSYELPDGVALRLRAGEQLLLNLHLFNATQAPISGNSGTFILSLAASEVEHVARALDDGNHRARARWQRRGRVDSGSGQHIFDLPASRAYGSARAEAPVEPARPGRRRDHSGRGR
jgi:hypothetical protein